MRILLILPYIPYPLDSGGNQAVFTMVDNLRKSHKVSMLLRGGRKEYIAALEHPSIIISSRQGITRI